MTVLEITELIKDKDASVTVYDNSTNKILDVALEDLHHATVKAISSDGNSFKVFVERQAERYYTYLDITYSTTVELDVPEYEDKREIFKQKAAEIINTVPDSFSIKGYSFRYSYDNLETGGLEDMIEKC